MVTVTLVREKETKSTIRYVAEVDGADIGMLYVPKSTVTRLGSPATLTLTLEAADAGIALAA